MLTSQRVAQVCLFLFAAIALFGGTVQMYLGQPDTTPRLDNIHRFLAGIYFGTVCGPFPINLRQEKVQANIDYIYFSLIG